MDDEVRGHGFDRLGSLIVNDVLMERVDKLAVFIYIPVDNLPEVQALQYDILDRFKPGIELTPVEPENLHITLLYLERAKDDALEEFFNNLTLSLPVSFEVEGSHVGTFAEADDKPVVLHISPSPSLLRLQNDLFNTAFSMGLPISVFSEPQNYKPHISLATGLKPPDAQIPDLKEPFKIPVTRIEATRPEYELIRTIHLPTFRKQDILVTQGDMPGPASEPGALGASIAGIGETDPRIAEMESGIVPEKLPISIQILYDPDLEKEGQGVDTQNTFDITLGPSFWEAHDEEKAGILARMYGLELARRMLLGPGGPHEWSRADALMSAPSSEVGLGHRYVFGNNSLTEAVADTYASLSLDYTEVERRGYEDAARWIGYAITQFELFEPVNTPDFRELALEIGDMPPFPGVTLIIERQKEEDDMSDQDLAVIEHTEEVEDETFAVTRSDLMQLLRGETLIRGPLRRTLTLSDGPFVIVEDEEPIERVKAPEPVEFTLPDPEPEPVEEPDLRERIGATLRNFVDGVFKLVGRGGPGSGFEGHAGRPGQVGGSAPSGKVTFADKPSPDMVAERMKKNFGIANDEIDRAAWIAPSGEGLAPDADHQETATHILSLLNLHPDTYKTPLTATVNIVDLGLVRYTWFADIHAFSLPRENLTKAQKDTIVEIMIKVKGRDPGANFSFDQAFAGGGRPEFRSLRGRQIAHLLKLNTDFWDVSGLTVSSISRGGTEVQRHGKHVGQEGREGAKGGSQPGFTHGDGKDEEDDRGSFEPREGLFHGTTIEAAKGIMENGLKVDFADDNNMKDGVVYATEDWFRALIFGHQSPGTTFGIVFFDPNKMGSKPEVDELGSFLYSEDVPPEAITKIELYELGDSGQPDDLIKTIERTEGKSEQFIAVGFDDDGSYSIMGNQQNQADVARHGEEHISQEGREGEKGGSQPGYTHGEGGDGSGEPQNGKSEGRRFTGDLQEEAHEWATGAFVGAKTFNDDSVSSLIDYKNYDAYETLNEALRDQEEAVFQDNEQLAKLRDTIDEAMEISTIPEDLVLYRGMSTDRLNRMAGEGKDFVDNSYVSTSLTPFETKTYASNKDRPSILEIHVPEGTSGIYMENFNEILLNEEEVLLDRGLKFRFVSDKPRVVFGTSGLNRDYEVWEVEIVGK